jgi:hypothetical protein
MPSVCVCRFAETRTKSKLASVFGKRSACMWCLVVGLLWKTRYSFVIWLGVWLDTSFRPSFCTWLNPLLSTTERRK